MKNNKEETSLKSSLCFSSVLAFVLVILKCCKIVDIPWWLVLMPIYGPYLFTGILLIIAIIIYGSNNYN